MKKLILTIGLPASGKSTWAEEQLQLDIGTYVCTKDDLRIEFPDFKEKEIVKLRDKITIEAFKAGKTTVIWADTNLNPVHENRARELASANGYEVEIKSFLNVTPEECIKRDLKREKGRVGSQVIWDMYWKYIATPEMKQDSNLPKAIICDIDGTLAHMDGRSPFAWDKVDEDYVDESIKNMINMYAENGYSVILFSGRDSKAFTKTLDWLTKNEISFSGLFLRPENDVRDDRIIKKEMFDREVKDKYFVEIVLDDRPKVVRMWKSLGLKVLNVQGHTDFEF